MAWQSSFMWDGAVNHLDVQALAPIHNKVEMDEDISNVLIKLKNSPVYPELFYQAYGDSIISGERVLKAISQFMLTLVSANSKYDQVMRNEREFTPQEANGYALFKQHCSSCHTEPLFTNHTFKSNSLQIDSGLNDFGRVSITSMPEDSFLFKVPTLRNIEFSFPYMHDGRFNSLLEVMNHYTNRDPLVSNTSQELSGKITLTSEQKVDIIAFLTTLSDKEFLFNPNYSFPRHLLLKNKPISNK
jgi:cytochrome c peroxidase